MYRWLCGLILLLWSVVAGAQNHTVIEGQGTPLLLIIGASYAADWGEPHIPGFSVRNAGVGGQETKDILQRFDRDVGAANPDAVLIWGHINNIHRAPNRDYVAAREAAQRDYLAMIERAGAAGVDVILATEITLTEAMSWTDTITSFVAGMLGKRSYADRINEHVRAVNEWLRVTARERGLRLLDFEAVLDDGSGFRRREFTQDDGSHVTEAAYRVLTDHTAGILAQR